MEKVETALSLGINVSFRPSPFGVKALGMVINSKGVFTWMIFFSILEQP